MYPLHDICYLIIYYIVSKWDVTYFLLQLEPNNVLCIYLIVVFKILFVKYGPKLFTCIDFLFDRRLSSLVIA
jgi:hypothetical protein